MYEYSIYIGPHSFVSFQFLLCHIIHSITYSFWIGEKKPLILKMLKIIEVYMLVAVSFPHSDLPSISEICGFLLSN